MEKVSIDDLLKFSTLIEKETYFNLLELKIIGAKYVNVPSGTLEKLKRMKKSKK